MDLEAQKNLEGFEFMSSEKTVLGFLKKISCPLNQIGKGRNRYPPLTHNNRLHIEQCFIFFRFTLTVCIDYVRFPKGIVVALLDQRSVLFDGLHLFFE